MKHMDRIPEKKLQSEYIIIEGNKQEKDVGILS